MDKQPRQSRSVDKTTGAKDSRSLAHNKNRSLEAPPLPDMSLPTVTGDGPSQEIVDACVALRRAGRTLPQISEALGVSLDTLHSWRERPDFLELTRNGFDDFADQKAEEVLQLADELPRIRGLGAQGKVMAMKAQIDARLRVAAARLPEWGRENGGEREIVVLEVGLGAGPIKTLGLPGTPDGQNILALKAGRWQKPPEDTEAS